VEADEDRGDVNRRYLEGVLWIWGWIGIRWQIYDSFWL